MDFGKIVRCESVIDLAEWDRIIEACAFLERIPDKTVTNPFTAQAIFVSGEGRAFYLENGAMAGTITLEGGELLTDGVPKAVCNAIASQLGATVLEDDRS